MKVIEKILDTIIITAVVLVTLGGIVEQNVHNAVDTAELSSISHPIEA